MPKKIETTIFDIWKKLRNLKYRLNNFFHYRLMVSSKHLLIVGGGNSELGQQLIKNFSDTWRIANVDFEKIDQCHLNLLLNKNENITVSEVETIEQKLHTFSKHYECVLCLPDERITNNIKDQSFFEAFDIYNRQMMERALLASYLAGKFLTPNGVIMFKGDEEAYSKPLNNDKMAVSLVMNQMHYLNLVVGDRDDIDVDAVSLTLLDRDKNKKIDNKKIEDKNNKSQQKLVDQQSTTHNINNNNKKIEENEEKKSAVNDNKDQTVDQTKKTDSKEQINSKETKTAQDNTKNEAEKQDVNNANQAIDNSKNDKQVEVQKTEQNNKISVFSKLFKGQKLSNQEKETQQLIQFIRIWAEGKKRPMPGTFVMFQKVDDKLVPDYL